MNDVNVSNAEELLEVAEELEATVEKDQSVVINQSLELMWKGMLSIS